MAARGWAALPDSPTGIAKGSVTTLERVTLSGDFEDSEVVLWITRQPASLCSTPTSFLTRSPGGAPGVHSMHGPPDGSGELLGAACPAPSSVAEAAHYLPRPSEAAALGAPRAHIYADVNMTPRKFTAFTSQAGSCVTFQHLLSAWPHIQGYGSMQRGHHHPLVSPC